MDFTLTDAQRELQERAAALALTFKDSAREWDETDYAPYPEIFERVGEAGLFGIAMPEEYGGKGGGAVEYLLVVEALFRHSQSWLPPEPVFCTSGPGPSMLLLGDEPVQEKYLHEIVSGRRACNIALTEPDAGSALTHLKTTAVKDGEDYLLTGEKSFLTGSNVNDLNATFVRFDEIPGAKGIGAIVVDADSPGVEVDRGPTFVGDRGIAHGNMRLTEVRVPKENLIVGPGQFARLMTAFNLERLHNCGFWLGFSQAAYDEAARYVQEREVFGRPEVEFQAVYHALADMSVQIEALRLLAYKAAAGAIEGRFPPLHEVTQAKLFGATVGPQITLKALELHGGYGVTTDYAIQRIHRDCITNVVAGGAPAVLRNGIAAGLFPGRRFPQG
jgi:alkylation response protein AidB-like acyl-CoA dehydrogenase